MTQEHYLQVFPRDYKAFLDLFDFHHELYDGHDYINVLPLLAANHDAQVGTLLVGLSKDARKQADAPTYLQLATAAYGTNTRRASPIC